MLDQYWTGDWRHLVSISFSAKINEWFEWFQLGNMVLRPWSRGTLYRSSLRLACLSAQALLSLYCLCRASVLFQAGWVLDCLGYGTFSDSSLPWWLCPFCFGRVFWVVFLDLLCDWAVFEMSPYRPLIRYKTDQEASDSLTRLEKTEHS